MVGDPTEGALITSAAKAGLSQVGLDAQRPRLDSIPFESEYQYMATLHDGTGRTIYVKGSVESLLRRCETMLLDDGQAIALDPAAIEAVVETMATKGLRVLAFAKKEVSSHQHSVDHEDLTTGLEFLGLQGMIDPPRPEAIAAVHACQTAGINVKMITGDHIATAKAIAQRMGIRTGETVIAFEGQDLEKMDPQSLAEAAETGRSLPGLPQPKNLLSSKPSRKKVISSR